MSGTVALRSVNKNFSESYSSAAILLYVIKIIFFKNIFRLASLFYICSTLIKVYVMKLTYFHDLKMHAQFNDNSFPVLLYFLLLYRESHFPAHKLCGDGCLFDLRSVLFCHPKVCERIIFGCYRVCHSKGF